MNHFVPLNKEEFEKNGFDKETYRAFLCLICQRALYIHDHCYRNHKYCFSPCRQIARKKSLRQAGKKYRAQKEAQMKNSRRQEKYYYQKKMYTLKKLTHHTYSHHKTKKTIIRGMKNIEKRTKNATGAKCLVCHQAIIVELMDRYVLPERGG